MELDFRFRHNLPNFYPIFLIIFINCKKLQGKNEEENFQLCEYWLTMDKSHI